MLWRIATDWRSGLAGLSAGMLQLMWPDLGRGVEEHSAFFTEPFDRINRSVPQIWATILADDADERGRDIRDLHTTIKGTVTEADGTTRRYHALDPDTFWWAHATFTWEMFQAADRFDHRTLSRARREQLYQETVTWYRRYGVSDRPVPADVVAFEARFEEICRTRLALTPSAARAVEMAQHERTPPPGIPRPVGAIVAPGMRLLSLGCLPAVVRRRFDIEWSSVDEAGLAAVTLGVRAAGAVVPQRLTRGPYLAAIRRMRTIAAPHPGSPSAQPAGVGA